MHNIGYAMHNDAYQWCNGSTSGQAVVFECIQRQHPRKYHRMSPATFAYAKPLYFLFRLSLFSIYEINIILFRRRLLTHWSHTGCVFLAVNIEVADVVRMIGLKEESLIPPQLDSSVNDRMKGTFPPPLLNR